MGNGEWGINTSELDALVKQLDNANANLELIAEKAVKSTTPIVKNEMSRQMSKHKSATPRKPRISRRTGSVRDKWRTGKHAADNIEVKKPKMSLRGNMFSIIGPSPDDNSPYFYMKFFEYGRSVYNRGTKSLDGYQAPDSYMNPTVDATRDKVINTMKDVLAKELGFDD